MKGKHASGDVSPDHTPPGEKWWIAPVAAGIVFVVAALGAARIETPTVDEFAHVPAGLSHWRTGQFNLYVNNPPLGKMWVAAPLAFDPSVEVPPNEGNRGGWNPWKFGETFERMQLERYLSLMFRARAMTVPLVLLAGWLIYRWARALFGSFAASMSASLFLLSPTILAHGHLATVDIASATTILASVMALRWSLKEDRWIRDLLAGAVLGVALSVKFSALFLVPLAPFLILMSTWLQQPRVSPRVTMRRLGLYTFAAWLVVNGLMGFQGTFDAVGSYHFDSQAMRSLAESFPRSMPFFLPHEYVSGLDALEFDIEGGGFPAYLAGRWSREGWRIYYPIAFLIKESEPIVVLVLLSLATLFAARRGIWETLLVALPPAVFLFIAIFLNDLCLGIRYILPAFPFLFVMVGSVFAMLESWLQKRATRRPSPETTWRLSWIRDPRLWIAVPLFLYEAVLAAVIFPGYLSYFNQFVGGSRNGPQWLLDSNFDWGQDLYRVPALIEQTKAQRLYLLYFGEVDSSVYGFDTWPFPDRPEFGLFAVSANFWKGANYAMKSRAHWMTPLQPTQRLGSIMVFDLRKPDSLDGASTRDLYNWAVTHLARGEALDARELLDTVLKQQPQSDEARFQYAIALDQLNDTAEAIRQYRQVLEQQPDWEAPLNNLAWHMASSADPAIRNPGEAVRLATKACQQTNRQNLSMLDTLANALAAAGQNQAALRVAREGMEKALKRQADLEAEEFHKLIRRLEAQEPSAIGPTR